MKISEKMKSRIMEALIAAITAFIAAITTTSCMGRGPLFYPNSPPLGRGWGWVMPRPILVKCASTQVRK